jgi:predicted MFS family arabinose efflux permease
MGAASLVGTVLLTPLLSDLPARRALSILLVGKAVVLAPLAVLGSPVVTGVALACAGLLDGPFYPISRSLIHRRVPADLRGRVFGAMGAVTGSAFPVGSALTGVALGATGAAWTVVLIAAAHLPLVAVAAATRSFRGPSAATAPGQEQDLGKGHPVGSNTSAS